MSASRSLAFLDSVRTLTEAALLLDEGMTSQQFAEAVARLGARAVYAEDVVGGHMSRMMWKEVANRRAASRRKAVAIDEMRGRGPDVPDLIGAVVMMYAQLIRFEICAPYIDNRAPNLERDLEDRHAVLNALCPLLVGLHGVLPLVMNLALPTDKPDLRAWLSSVSFAPNPNKTHQTSDVQSRD